MAVRLARPTGIRDPAPPLSPRPYSQSTHYYHDHHPQQQQQRPSSRRASSRASTTVRDYSYGDDHKEVEMAEPGAHQDYSPSTVERVQQPSQQQLPAASLTNENVIVVQDDDPSYQQEHQYVQPGASAQHISNTSSVDHQVIDMPSKAPIITAAMASAALAEHQHQKHLKEQQEQSTMRKSTMPYDNPNEAPCDINPHAPYPVSLFPESRNPLPNFKLISMTNLIVIVCTVVMMMELIIGQEYEDGAFVSSNAMGGPSIKTLYDMGAVWEPSVRGGAVWRLVTGLFLHVGILHWAMNMSSLIVIGYTFERRFNPFIFLIIFLATGILGNIWSCVSYAGTVAVGASGGVLGLVGADVTYVMYNYPLIRKAGLEFVLLVIFAGVTFAFGFLSILGDALDNYAHLGGCLSGLCLGLSIVPFPVMRSLWFEIPVRLVAFCVFLGLYALFSVLLWVENPNGPTNVDNL